MIELLQSIKSFVQKKPELASLLVPWFFVSLPIIFVPYNVMEWMPAKSFADMMASWAPMIDRYAQLSPHTGYMRFALSCFWISGPICSLFTAAVCYWALRSGVLPTKKPAQHLVVWAFLLVSGMAWMLANSTPSSTKQGVFWTYVFSTGMGLVTIGWCVFAALFFICGFALAASLNWFVGRTK